MVKRAAPSSQDFLRLQASLPDSPHYERSFMHRENITSIAFSTPTNFLLTGSDDGHIKFWKKKDQSLATAADAEPGNSTASTNTSHSILQKAKQATDKNEDMTFFGESLEFVKQYRAHLGAIDMLVLSNDKKRACTICSYEQSIKIFDVENFDMISMHKALSVRPWRVQFCYNHSEDDRLIAVSCQLTGRIEFIDIEHLRHEVTISRENDDVVEPPKQKTLLKISESICSTILYHNNDPILITFHLDGAINFVDVNTREISTIKRKDHGDLFNLQKDKTFALTADQNYLGTKFAVYCNDRTIRIFSYTTGKQVAKLDETIRSLRAQQKTAQSLQLMEFEQRVLNEKKLDKEINAYLAKGQCPSLNLCSGVKFYRLHGDDLLVYASMLCIRIFSLDHRRTVSTKPIGIADNVRSTQIACAFEPFQSVKKITSLDALLANNPNLRAGAVIDPIVFTSSFNKNRFFVFSQRESGEGDRDIFNEKPTAEEMLAAQKGEETKRIGDEAILHTSFGDISVKLFGNECPKTVENFTVHARDGYYNGMIFHRVIKNFMVQTGCPNGNGRGGESIWGGDFDDEYHPSLNHEKPYMLSMANAGPNTNGSQFFVTVVPCPYLDGKHAIFGRVLKGMNVVQNISQTKVFPKTDKPVEEVKLVSVTVKLRKFQQN